MNLETRIPETRVETAAFNLTRVLGRNTAPPTVCDGCGEFGPCRTVELARQGRAAWTRLCDAGCFAGVLFKRGLTAAERESRELTAWQYRCAVPLRGRGPAAPAAEGWRAQNARLFAELDALRHPPVSTARR